MSYIDGFVAAVPTVNREVYKKHAEDTRCARQARSRLRQDRIGRTARFPYRALPPSFGSDGAQMDW